MKNKLFEIVLTLFASVNIAVAQTADDYTAPRTEWDQPDLQGVWSFVSSTPLQRPERFGTREFLTPEEVEADFVRQKRMLDAANAREAELVVNPEAPAAGSVGGYNSFWFEGAGVGKNQRTSLIVYPPNGRLPDTVEGAAIHLANLGDDVPGVRPVLAMFGGIGKNGPEDRGLSERCLVGFNAGPPLNADRFTYNANLQIIQNRDHVVIMTEMVHDARIVPLDGRDYLEEDLQFWSGDSRGHWEGDTLVVKTKNFTPRPGLYGADENLQVTERFRRVDDATLSYSFVVDNPTVWSEPWGGEYPWPATTAKVYEYACHEGNYALGNIMRGARLLEAEALQANANKAR